MGRYSIGLHGFETEDLEGLNKLWCRGFRDQKWVFGL